jgi:hypothetical protein
METAALLVVLAAIGGVVVVRTVLGDQTGARKPVRRTQPGDDESPTAPVPLPDTFPGEPIARPADPRRRSRRILTAAALTDTLAIDGDEELRPTFFGRTLAFGRLLLVILFICALAGGTLFWMAMMIASRAHIHPG